MNDQTTPAARTNESEIDDDSIGASIKIDWDEIIASVDPDNPLGHPVFNSEDYETEEEEEAAWEAFVARVSGEFDGEA